MSSKMAPALDAETLRRGDFWTACTQDLSRVADALNEGRIPTDRYQVWVEVDALAVVPLHNGERTFGEFEHFTPKYATAAALRLLGTYSSVWIVTVSGIWRVRTWD